MRTLLILVLIAVLLAAFNPNMDDFRQHVRTHSERIVQQEAGDTALGQLLSGAAAALAGRYVDRVTERDNYLVLSIYTMDLDGPEESGNEWRFLGIAKQFIELERPDALQEAEGGK